MKLKAEAQSCLYFQRVCEKFSQCVNAIEMRRWSLRQPSEFNDSSEQGIGFQRSPRLNVLQHRSLMVSDLLRTCDALFERYSEGNAEFVGDSLRFGHHGRGQRTSERILAD